MTKKLIAYAIDKHWELGNKSSILITSPIKEEDAIDNNEVNIVIKEAMILANKDGIRGPAMTPYLMKAVGKATHGRTVKANMSVLISTAELAGRLAKAHSLYRQKDSTIPYVNLG